VTVRSIDNLTSPEVAGALRDVPTAVIPLGSVEQHGPHLPCGTDIFAAEIISREVADQLSALYVPAGPYGVTPIHAGHPGTISLRRSTFEALLTDIITELSAMGVRNFVLVNWHEGNTPSADAVCYTMQKQLECNVVVAQACYVAQDVYAPLGGELTHGGGIETAAVMAHDPALVHVERAGEPTRPQGALELDRMRRAHDVYGFVTNVRELADAGWYGNPSWATDETAAAFVSTVAGQVVKQVSDVLAIRTSANAVH
jgi:creatinine amidohydrolase